MVAAGADRLRARAHRPALQAGWDPDDAVLHGTVRGQGGRVYHVAALSSGLE